MPDYSASNIITLQNIDDEDFEFEYDKSSGNWPYVIPAGEIRRFPRFLADHALKHLLDKILTKRNIKTNNETERATLASQIVVGEESFQQRPQKTEIEKQKEEIDRLNKPSELDAILGKRRAPSEQELALKRQFGPDGQELPKGNPSAPVEPLPTGEPTQPDVVGSQSATEEQFVGLNEPSVASQSVPLAPVEVELKPEVAEDGTLPGEIDLTEEDDETKEVPKVDSTILPTRFQLADYAKNTLKMKFDEKTTKQFQEDSIENLVQEIDYPMEGVK